MPNIILGPFAGQMPRVSPKLLNQQYAQSATNVNVDRGRLEPSKEPGASVYTLQAPTRTIYWYNRDANAGAGYWLEWDHDVNVVRGPIADDPFLRTYFTSDTGARLMDVTLAQTGLGPYPGASHQLGLPAPAAPTAAGPTGPVPDGAQEIETAYVVTYVSQFGEEGPHSAASNVVTRWDGGTVELTNISVAGGDFVVSTKRIYRIELNGVYQRVAEIPAAQTTYTDNNDSKLLGSPVPSEDWDAPHADMRLLTALPNGILAGAWGNTLAFCEPYQLHAWPIRYQLALDYDIVGMAVSAYGLIVVTTGSPYLIAGSSPEAMSQNKMDLTLAGVSKRSIVDMGEYVVYASADGLVAAGGTQAQVITEAHITPRQWRARYFPSTIHAYRWGEYYLAFYDNGEGGAAFTFHPQEGFRDFSEYADCAFVDDESGDVYVKQGTALCKWDSGADASYLWRSKVLEVPSGTVYAAAKVEAQSYPANVNFYADGALIKTKSVANRKAFRLPTKSQYEELEVEVSGSAIVDRIQIATSMNELY